MGTWVKRMLKGVVSLFRATLVDPVVYVWRDLLGQPYIMWAFIGWGWLCVLAMVASAVVTYADWAGGL